MLSTCWSKSKLNFLKFSRLANEHQCCGCIFRMYKMIVTAISRPTDGMSLSSKNISPMQLRKDTIVSQFDPLIMKLRIVLTAFLSFSNLLLARMFLIRCCRHNFIEIATPNLISMIFAAVKKVPRSVNVANEKFIPTRRHIWITQHHCFGFSPGTYPKASSIARPKPFLV